VVEVKWYKFFLYLIKHGSWSGKPVDFDSHRNGLMKSLPIDQPKKSTYIKFRKVAAKTRFLGPLIGNLAYLKNVNRIHRNFIFVDALKIGYVRILKSASTSIVRELLPWIDERLRQAQLSDQQVDQLGVHYGSHSVSSERKWYPLFTIVRNPFHRLVSVYQDIFNPENREFAFRSYLFGLFRRDMSFKDFVRVVSIIPDKLKEPHFVPQSIIISECGGLDKIRCFRLEKDGEVIKQFMMNYGLVLGHSNRAPNYTYQDFYDIDTCRLAYSIYERDIETFGYHDEYLALLRYLKT
jgi:Sulfotransferase family